MISIPSLCLVSNLLSLVSQVCTLQYFFSVEGPRTNVEGRHTRTHSYAHARTCTYIHPQTYTQHTHAHHTHTCIQRIYTYTTHNIPHAHKHTRIYTVHTHTHTHTHTAYTRATQDQHGQMWRCRGPYQQEFGLKLAFPQREGKLPPELIGQQQTRICV